jgi:hypothetical protein
MATTLIAGKLDREPQNSISVLSTFDAIESGQTFIVEGQPFFNSGQNGSTVSECCLANDCFSPHFNSSAIDTNDEVGT